MEMIAFDAILFPADGRPPHLVALMTSPMSGLDPHCVSSRQARMPHPEVHMDYVAEGLGSQAWHYQVRLFEQSLCCKIIQIDSSLLKPSTV